MVPTRDGATPHDYRGHLAGPAPLAQWIGLFLAPAAFFLHLQGGYLLVLNDCGRDGGAGLVHAAGIVALLLAPSPHPGDPCRPDPDEREQPSDSGDALGRTRLMAAFGLGVSAHLALVLAAQLVMGFTIPRCQ